MLRVGLTGGLGSGKTTVAEMFSALGASVSSADEIGRKLMQPGEQVYTAIVHEFGPQVVKADGSLDRKALAKLAFQHNRADALNRIVHPAVVAAEEDWMQGIFDRNPVAVAIVESALIFEVEKWRTAPGWKDRFDKLILVAVPDEVKIKRYVARAVSAAGGAGEAKRAALEQDARARLAIQIPDQQKFPFCDYIILNTSPLEELRTDVTVIYRELKKEAKRKVPV